MPIVWLPIVGVLGYLTYKNYKKINQLKTLNLESVLLMLEIPKNNDKKELSAEQMFASLHGILKDTELLCQSGTAQEHLSFEIVSSGGQIRFYVYVPKTLQSFVEGQIYAQYPSVQIHVVDKDYTETVHSHNVVYTSELLILSKSIHWLALPAPSLSSIQIATKSSGSKSSRAQSPIPGTKKPTLGSKLKRIPLLRLNYLISIGPG